MRKYHISDLAVHLVLCRGRRYYEPVENLRPASASGTHCDPMHQGEQRLKVAWRILFFPPYDTLRYNSQQTSNAINGGSLP